MNIKHSALVFIFVSHNVLSVVGWTSYSEPLAEDYRLLREEVRILNEKFRQLEQILQRQVSKEELDKKTNAYAKKRFVVDGEINVEQEIISLKRDMDMMKQSIASTYVRWGRTTCPANATLVYKDEKGTLKATEHDKYRNIAGYTGGNEYTDNGGPANYVCLPEDPTWGKYQDGIQSNGNKMFGTEYELFGSFNPFANNMHDEDAPCAVCRTPYPTTIMIPARTGCYPGWHQEYSGYIMAISSPHPAASEYICVDNDPEAILHGSGNQNGNVLYVVEAVCGSLPCLPYVDGRELACVVCSK